MKKILFSLAVFAAFSVSAQKVSGKLSFQKGQTIEVTSNTNMTMQMMMGEIPTSIVSVEQYTVGEAGPDGIQIIKTPKRIQLKSSAMGQEMSVDTDKPQDLESQLGQPFKEMMKQKQEFTIDAMGKVIAVKSDEKAKKPGEAGLAGMMMPGMSMGIGAPVVGQYSAFRILPAREVGKGDTWTDSVATKENSGTTVYTVKDITDSEILLDFTGQSKTKTTQSQMGMSVDVTADTKSSGTVTLDRATGLLKQRTMNATTESNMNMGGQEMAATTKMTVVITAKTL